MSAGAEDGIGPGPRGGSGPEARGGPRPGAVAERIAALLAARGARSVPDEHAEARAAVLLLLKPGTAAGGAAEPAVSDRRAGTGGVGGAGLSAPAGGQAGTAPPADAASGGPTAAPHPAGTPHLPLELRGWEALFVLRVERDGDPWSGQVGLPGGYREAGDPDLAAAALRELEEETGLELSRSCVLGRLDEIHPRSRRLPSVAVAPFVAWSPAPGPVREGPEISAHFWAPLAELVSPRRRSVLSFRRSGAFHAFPTVEYQGHTVWGLTYVIVRRFLGLLAAGAEPGAGGGTGADRGGERDAAVGRTQEGGGEGAGRREDDDHGEGSWPTS